MARYDVNAARAQRLEVSGARWEFELDGEVFSLPVELSRGTVTALSTVDQTDLDGLLLALLGEEQFTRFDKHEISVQDVQGLLEAYGRATGMSLGESSASTSS